MRTQLRAVSSRSHIANAWSAVGIASRTHANKAGLDWYRSEYTDL